MKFTVECVSKPPVTSATVAVNCCKETEAFDTLNNLQHAVTVLLH